MLDSHNVTTGLKDNVRQNIYILLLLLLLIYLNITTQAVLMKNNFVYH